MRERTNEVQMLKKRISELEDREAGNSFDALFNDLTNTSLDDMGAFHEAAGLSGRETDDGDSKRAGFTGNVSISSGAQPMFPYPR